MSKACKLSFIKWQQPKKAEGCKLHGWRLCESIRLPALWLLLIKAHHDCSRGGGGGCRDHPCLQAGPCARGRRCSLVPTEKTPPPHQQQSRTASEMALIPCGLRALSLCLLSRPADTLQQQQGMWWSLQQVCLWRKSSTSTQSSCFLCGCRDPTACCVFSPCKLLTYICMHASI